MWLYPFCWLYLHFDFVNPASGQTDVKEKDLATRSDIVRRDVILGGEGKDILSGGSGEDWILGGPDNDVLFGGLDQQASDLLFGEIGIGYSEG